MGVGNKMFVGAIWSGLEKIALKVVSFLLGIVLARLLTPEEYGTVGLITVFITISHVFIDSGFSSALIQKKDRNQNDIATVFLFNLAIAFACYVILFFSAPLIAEFYAVPILKNLIRVLSISLIINASFTIQSTLLTVEMDFKALAKIKLSAVIISGLTAIYLAYEGFGVWALVAQVLIRGILMAALMWYARKWKLQGEFSKTSLKQLFSYGSKLLVSNLMATFFSNLNILLIGKYISTEQLGFYTRGVQFADVVSSVFGSGINSVLLPGLAPHQDDKEVLTTNIKKVLKASSIITVPILFFLAVIAEPLIRILLTDKWLLAAPIMQLYCCARLITIFCGINVSVLYIIGRTDLVLKQQYYCIFIRIILVLLALNFGIVYIALAELIATSTHFFINSYYPGKFMGYGALKQIKDLSPILVSGLFMSACLVGLNYLIYNDWVFIAFATILGFTSYFFMLKFFKVKELDFLLEKLSKLKK